MGSQTADISRSFGSQEAVEDAYEIVPDESQYLTNLGLYIDRINVLNFLF